MWASQVRRGGGASAGAPAGTPPAPSPSPPAGKPDRPPTAFERRVYTACSAIPAGRVATYGVLADVLASSARAVGQALRRNPYAPRVPCHRVVAAGQGLGGFSGTWVSE